MKIKLAHHKKCVAAHLCPRWREPLSDIKCVNGKAGRYDCHNVDLLSFVPVHNLGSEYVASDLWGWTDSETGDEIAIIGMEDGTAFVQVTYPTNPVVLGFLPQSGNRNTIWTDMKVFANHVFVVKDQVNHGLQIMDLTKLRQFYGQPASSVRQLTHDSIYREIAPAHNIAINEQTGFAYLVGSNTCSGGLHAVDISDPINPSYAGCFGSDGYTHDAQCVIYNGPETNYKGHEICFNFNEDTLTIVDVTDKAKMRMLSRTSYPDAFYTHQGWLTEDMSFLLSNDEFDERKSGNPHTRTLLWNVEDLENPVLVGCHFAQETATDHNLYIRGNLTFLTNYCSGLRLWVIPRVEKSETVEVGFFDAADYCNSVKFEGTWSNYPFFDSGNVIVSSIELGLFVLRPQYDKMLQSYEEEEG